MEGDRDPLDAACDQIWEEIMRLIPQERALAALGEAATLEERKELRRVADRLASLRWYSRRYREVIRDGLSARRPTRRGMLRDRFDKR
jgi:hypothetical protein